MTPGERQYEVLFRPGRKTATARAGESLMSVAQRAGIELEGACGGKGTCGKCRCVLVEGALSPPTREELDRLSPDEIARNARLACQARVEGDVQVRVSSSPVLSLRVVEQGQLPVFERSPSVEKAFLELPEPASGDQAAHMDRIGRALGLPFSETVSLRALRVVPDAVKESGFRVTAVITDGKVTGVEAGDTTDRLYGLALDVGTTTVVAALADLAKGEEIGVASMANSQRDRGHDVITRIQFACEEGGLERLKEAVVGDANLLIGRVCESCGVSRDDIYEVVVAGNTTMLHLFAGVSPRSIGIAPYVSTFDRETRFDAREMGIEISGYGRVVLLPSVSSYVGADIVAGLVASDLFSSDEPVLFIDIGTNGEIVIASGGRVVACSCAAGPALEGMNIECGMVAVEGAVERVEISGGEVELATVGGAPPGGLSGSGVVDAVAELLRSGAINPSGRMQDRAGFLENGGHPGLAQRFYEDDDRKFLLFEGPGGTVFVSQRDIRQVQLAKGAVRSGIEALLEAQGMTFDEVARVNIAGGFGRHLRLGSLVGLGLIPGELADKATFVGNSAKVGALLALLDREKRSAMRALARRVEYFELSTYRGYKNLFVKEMRFPDGL